MIFSTPITKQLLETWPMNDQARDELAGMGGLETVAGQIGQDSPAIAFTTPMPDGSNLPLLIAGLVPGGVGGAGERRAELWSLPSVHIGFRLKSLLIMLRRYLPVAMSLYEFDVVYALTEVGAEKAERFIAALHFVPAPDFDYFEAPDGTLFYVWKYEGERTNV